MARSSSPLPPSSSSRASSPSSEDPPPDAQLAKEARLKRRIAELEAERDVASAAPKTTAAYASASVTTCRALRKTVSLFDPLEDSIAEYDRRQELEETRELEGDTTPVEHTAEQDRLYRGYLELIKFVPGLKSAIVNCHMNELAAILGQLRKGAAGAMCDDNGSVRSAMVGWIGKNAKPPLDASSRVHRGLEGDVTGPLLFPVDYDHNDPEQVSPSVTDPVRAKVNNGDKDFMVTADQWPRGVYLNGVYDPANEEKGLFKSLSLVQTFMHIFTSPKSADKLQAEGDEENVQPSESTGEPPRKKRKRPVAASKSSVATKIGMRRVTSRSIGYAAVELFVLVSIASISLTPRNGTRSTATSTKPSPPGPVAKKAVDELRAWWDQRVFKNSGRSTTEASGSRAKSSVLTMRERRAARELNT
ncbi:hypothetical protein DFH09DRAFT_1098367 [Mycena vulgaris]|nr:hypothetical protein DFH09DRAFT_1098367 [Mycena vulgaris]